MKGAKRKLALTKTTSEYASRSSIHGIGYIFDREIGIFDRVFWLLVVVAFLAVAAKITKNFWSQWREEQVDVKPPAVKFGIFCIDFTNYNRFDYTDIFRL